jgi:hypothetical protein
MPIYPTQVGTAPHPQPILTSVCFKWVSFLQRPRPAPLMVFNNNEEVGACNLYSRSGRSFADIIDALSGLQSSSANVVKSQTGYMDDASRPIINEARPLFLDRSSSSHYLLMIKQRPLDRSRSRSQKLARHRAAAKSRTFQLVRRGSKELQSISKRKPQRDEATAAL